MELSRKESGACYYYFLLLLLFCCLINNKNKGQKKITYFGIPLKKNPHIHTQNPKMKQTKIPNQTKTQAKTKKNH